MVLRSHVKAQVRHFRPDVYASVEGTTLLQQQRAISAQRRPTHLLREVEEEEAHVGGLGATASCGGCSGHGQCRTAVNGESLCLCQRGWGGVGCAQPEAVLVEAERGLARLREEEQAEQARLELLRLRQQRSSSSVRRPEADARSPPPAASVTELYAASQVQRVQNAVRAASQAADRLLARARLEASQDATRRFEEALRRAQENSKNLPGHEYLKSEDMLVDDRGHISISSETTQLLGVSTEASACGAASACSGHGTCDEGAARCDCEEGWSGLQCDLSTCTEDCNNNGLCVAGRCICHSGFYGESCSHKRCLNDCSGNGYCHMGLCQCTGDFGGQDCSSLAHSDKVVSFKLQRKTPLAKGAPDASVSTVRATAGAAASCIASTTCSGHGQCDAEGACTCDEWWYGPHCEDNCEGGCTGHGDCLPGGTCLCNTGFSGAQCEQQVGCNGHGSRATPDGTVGGETCECDPGWTGPDCAVAAECPDATCSGHGVCQSTGSCLCGPGYSGMACELAQSGCSLTGCAGNGVCDEVTAMCNCKSGFVGLTCETALWQCPENCNGHGTCMGGFCACWPDWDGVNCATQQASLATAANATLGLLSKYVSGDEGSDGEEALPKAPAAAQQTPRKPSGAGLGARVLALSGRVGSPSTASWIPAAAAAAAAVQTSAAPDPEARLPPALLAAGHEGEPEHRSGTPRARSTEATQVMLEAAQQPALNGALLLQPSEAPQLEANPRQSLLAQQRSLPKTLISAPEGSNEGPSGGANVLMSLLGGSAKKAS